MTTHALRILTAMALASCAVCAVTNRAAAWPWVSLGLLLHAVAFACFRRALIASRPALKGKGLVPVIGRHTALTEALHARLSISEK